LRLLKEKLANAEELLRRGQVSQAVEYYYSIRQKIFHKDNIGSIYFNQKCIYLSNRYKLTKHLIKYFISMGTLFSNTQNTDDFLLSLFFKEEAKKLFKLLGEKDDTLEIEILESLVILYKELVTQNECQENFQKTMEYLRKQLENLESLIGILSKHKDKGEKEREHYDSLFSVFLKIAQLYYKQGSYEDVLDTLQTLINKIEQVPSDRDINNIYRVKGQFLSAETKEQQGRYREAIEELIRINSIQLDSKVNDENIFAKCHLNLGRLFYKLNNLNESAVNLERFFKKAKTSDSKELLDIARVNLGMIRATQSMDSHIKKMTTSDYSEFLKLKLKYFNE
jgi:tetratricopeptide (TPR) repeat protein